MNSRHSKCSSLGKTFEFSIFVATKLKFCQIWAKQILMRYRWSLFYENMFRRIKLVSPMASFGGNDLLSFTQSPTQYFYHLLNRDGSSKRLCIPALNARWGEFFCKLRFSESRTPLNTFCEFFGKQIASGHYLTCFLSWNCPQHRKCPPTPRVRNPATPLSVAHINYERAHFSVWC